MSYLDDLRGALAATSGASRRIQALHALGISADDQATVQGFLDDATSSLIEAVNLLNSRGHSATGSKAIADAAAKTGASGWREEVYGGRKAADTTSRVMGAPRAKRTYEEVFPEDKPKEVDISHPWRSEERQ